MYTAEMKINFLDNIYTVIIYKDFTKIHGYVFHNLGSAYKFLHFYINGEK